jgi:hypothetical protein
MKHYKIQATYHVDKILIVQVEDGKDPSDPNNWDDIIFEDDLEHRLYDNDTAYTDDETAELDEL